MREIFLEIDKDHSGSISAEEFAQALRTKGNNLPEEDVMRLVRVRACVYRGRVDTSPTWRMIGKPELYGRWHVLMFYNSNHRLCQYLSQEFHRFAYAFTIHQDADIDGDGTIDYEEFLAATINQSKLEREEHLKSAFMHFDLNGDGQITHEELMAVSNGPRDERDWVFEAREKRCIGCQMSSLFGFALQSLNKMGISDSGIQEIIAEVDKDGR